MATQFTCPGSPHHTVACPYCQQAVEGGYDLDGKCDPWCDGTMQVNEAPWCEIGCGNVGGIFRLLNLPGGEDGSIWGGIEAKDVADLRRRILKALNVNRDHLVVVPYEEEGGQAGVVVTKNENVLSFQRMGAGYISMGNTDEQTVRRLTDLDTLARYAQEKGYGISWS